MKICLFLAACFCFNFGFAQQKYAVVDLEYILGYLPEYVSAQKEIERYAQEWEQMVEKKWQEVNQLKLNLQNESVLLTASMLQKREEEILKKEEEAKNFQKKKFGVDGEIFLKRRELVRPIQEKVYKAIKSVCTAENIGMVLDKSSEYANIVYVHPKINKSDDVLKNLGIDPKKRAQE